MFEREPACRSRQSEFAVIIMLQLRPLRLLVAAAAATCAACSHQNGNIQGLYTEPGGATLRLAADRYEFCTKTCTSGALQARPLDDRSGRVSFFGVPVSAFFRERQARDGQVLTWGEGVETNYTLGPFGGASIEIDAARGLYFKRR